MITDHDVVQIRGNPVAKMDTRIGVAADGRIVAVKAGISRGKDTEAPVCRNGAHPKLEIAIATNLNAIASVIQHHEIIRAHVRIAMDHEAVTAIPVDRWYCGTC